MFELFSEGGPWGMSLLTVELICLLFAAWKAPAWVKEIGLLAPVTAFVYMLIGYSCRTAGRGYFARAAGGRFPRSIHPAGICIADLRRVARDPDVAEAAHLIRKGASERARGIGRGMAPPCGPAEVSSATLRQGGVCAEDRRTAEPPRRARIRA